jgi:hypothetical protein
MRSTTLAMYDHSLGRLLHFHTSLLFLACDGHIGITVLDDYKEPRDVVDRRVDH